jgi:hypothetical protein
MDRMKFALALSLSLLLWAPPIFAQPKSDAPAAAEAPKPAASPAAPRTPHPSVLKAVPADAWGFLAAPDLEHFNKDILALAQRIGLPVGPGGMIGSPLEFVKMNLGLDQGLATHGGVAVVVLPGNSFSTANERVALLLPTGDIKALTAPFGAADAGDNLLRASYMQQQFLIGSKNGYAVLTAIEPAPEEDEDQAKANEAKAKKTIEAVTKSEKSIDAKMDQARVADFDKNDLYVWGNLDALVKAAKEEGLLESLMAAVKANAGPDQQFQLLGLGQLIELIDQASSVAIGLNLDDKGIGLHVVGSAQPDSELGRYLAGPTDTDKPLMVGLPDEPFVLAIGQRIDKAQAKLAAQNLTQVIDAFFASDDVKSLINLEKLAPFKEKLLQVPTTLGGELFSFSVSALPQGPDGLVGVAMVVDCDDSAAAQELVGGLLTAAKDVVTDEQIKEALEVVHYTPKAETLDGVRVDHVVVDLKSVTELDAQDIAIAEKIVGNEGMLMRILAPTPTRLAVVFGGGKKRASEVLAICKASQAPLADNTGIQRVQPALPKMRNLDFFVALDNGFALVKNIMTVRGEMLPIDLPKVDAPVAIIRSGDADTGRVDLFIPIQLIQPLAQMAMQAMMGGGGL